MVYLRTHVYTYSCSPVQENAELAGNVDHYIAAFPSHHKGSPHKPAAASELEALCYLRRRSARVRARRSGQLAAAPRSLSVRSCQPATYNNLEALDSRPPMTP